MNPDENYDAPIEDIQENGHSFNFEPEKEAPGASDGQSQENALPGI